VRLCGKIFDVSDPTAPQFIDYINNRDPDAEPALDNGSDYGPEGILFIDAMDSPVRCPLLVVSNEVSGTTTLFRLESTRRPRTPHRWRHSYWCWPASSGGR